MTIETEIIQPVKDFIRDSKFLVNRCTKPDKKEFTQTATATAVGFVVMGLVGYFVKLIHIPINNILIGA
ncbi:putative translocase SEC61 subunit gamma [Blastocystis sp. subtype 4]|uniref:putative translocase SEC61 subunit gamma n=1 Tax=Blastocystis sp. subtype 4 TaxID=944170 RepID=UPI000711A4F3|nr:putative translocase SEC61 subunit gamma [Blastocystis sp. subtype 4]KNB44210.1 putative translocase SEC61 subunit gamma [Blastocystis sp. subtype 4]|eukprot:XP_014527653.1 putative translocase SEC61 subunit gamma [Blastocystis sp. subtype 4]